jgi:hypothetical protein
VLLEAKQLEGTNVNEPVVEATSTHSDSEKIKGEEGIKEV